MSENEATSDQDDVSFIRTDDMVCLQCSETGERVCLAAEGFGNRHCFLEPIANKNYPPEMPSCVFVIEQALSVRALQEMVTAESSDLKQGASQVEQLDSAVAGEEVEPGGSDAQAQLSAIQLTSAKGSSGGDSGGVGGGNRTLLYGHAVLLRHFHSGMYLATLPICSSSDKLAFDVGLKDVDEIGESCWWTVHPGSKQRSEGEKVRFGDDLILVSVATERYLHFTNTDEPLTAPMASASAAAVNKTMASVKQAIVNASFHSTHWSIAPFGTGLSRMKNVGYVFGGQVLRLLHGGDECLTVSIQQGASASTGASASNDPQQQLGEPSGNQNINKNQLQQTANLAGSPSPVAQQQQQQTIDVVYEGGPVMNQARSLWRLDLIRTKWSGGFVQYSNALRIRHITTGKYLGVNDHNQLCLLSKIEATVEKTAFCLRLNKDDSKGGKGSDGGDDKDEEVIGSPAIKYGDTSFFIQHIDTQMWLSYRSYETKKRGIGRVEEKQAILLTEGKMDDCLEFSRSQEEEAKTARVIRKCDALFSKFIKILDHVQQLAAAQKSNEFDLINSSIQENEGELSRQQSGKRRGSVATSAVAAAALSGLAPIFSASLDQAAVHRGSISVADQAERQRRLDSTVALSSSLFPYTSQVEMSKCLEDLIDYFAPPEEGCDHEQEQNRLRALRNRQDLFQEEGILNLILDAIDKINLISGQGLLVLLLGEESSSTWEAITGYFYQLLAAIIKDNHTNCAQFAQSHRLNWLFSRLSSQQASEGTGMLDVLHCVLVDSPEALNMLKESHIKVLISLLEKHGRDPKVLNVLCSLCVSNGVAIRSSQNTITNHLLPGRNLLLQTRLIDEVASMKPNIYIARVDGSSMYHRWYYEVIVDHIELINNLSSHLRIGWANTKGYLPYPGGGQYWGSNGVGDDFYSYGFDGQYLWTAGRPTLVRIPPTSAMTRQEVMNNQYYEYQNQQQAMLESYANQQKEFVDNQAAAQQQQQQLNQGTSDGLTSISNIDTFAQSPYLRLQKGDVIGCLIDLSVPTIQFTINGKQIFGFFKNFNVTNGGFFHPVISFSAKVSCRFLFGGNQGELNYRPPAGFSPLVDVLLPGQDVTVEPCFSFGDLGKQTVCGPQITPDSLPQTVMDLIFIPRVIDTQSIELASQLKQLRDNLAENMHELWCMSRIEDGWTFGEEHDEENQTHPYIAPFNALPALAKKYKLDLATQTLKIILGLGFKVTPVHQQHGAANQPGQRLKTYKLPQFPYHQARNDYKPAPLDLSNLDVTAKINHLVELLAENIHNIWAAEKISMKWTYKRRDPNNELDDDFYNGRSCHLLPYKFVDDSIKMKNRQSALETVLTLIAHGYQVESMGQGWDQRPAGGGVDAVGSMTPMIADGPAGEQHNLLSPSPSAAASPGPSRPVSAASGNLAAGGSQAGEQQLTGYEVILNNAPEIGVRHYRAERTYAVQSGRWYYEVEICTLGHVQIGWANLDFQSSSSSLGCDERSWAFDCHTGRKVHASNYESFGKVASVGDVIGCMLDLNDRTISYSLNGKLMLDYLGNEMAFASLDWSHSSGGSGAGGSHAELTSYVPAVSLGINQRVRLSFGQDVEQLRFFTDYGLQEGYHPFCVNMHKPITLWYNKREANFVSLDELNPNQVNVEVTRIPPGSDSPPSLKIAYKQFESQERANWEYLRLSLPVTINAELLDETDKIAKMQEIQAQQLRLAYSKASESMSKFGSPGLAHDGLASNLRHPARLEQHMLQSGFSMADVKDLQRSYESPDSSSKHEGGVHFGRQLPGRRQPLVKTRSVDEQKSAAVPSLAVPSFTEAQRMMSESQRHEQQRREQHASLAKRRNTGFNLLRASSNSMDDISKQQQQQAGQQQRLCSVEQQNAPGLKTTRSKSTFKSIFGSMKSRAPSEPPRAQSLSRGTTNEPKMMVPKISIETQGQSDSPAGVRGRSLSRAGSYSNLSTASGLGLDSLSPGASQEPSRGGFVRRLSRVGLGVGGGSSGQQGASKTSAQTQPTSGAHHQQAASERPFERVSFDLQQLDSQTLELIDEYYYGVRIFPGQEPLHVMCGWVTSHFKHENLSSLQDVQHTQIIQSTSLITGQAEICERRECYLLNAGQLYKEVFPAGASTAGSAGAISLPLSATGAHASPASAHDQSSLGVPGTSGASPPSSAPVTGAGAASETTSSRSNRGMLIGCHVDTSTGVLTFTVDGRLAKYKFQLEPQTKLYPAIFFQASTGDCLQFELSRTPLTLPLSAAILSLTSKHIQPQCPARLKVQTMRACSWSRVPNVSLRPNALKLSESKKGWSMLAVDPLSVLAVHIPEENRCLDVLELIEHEKLLRFHSHTLALYGALCAQGNHKVAHIICSHVDQRQLLYAINSDYLSGELRRAFADLLIALHLEFHAYGRHLTQNEFIVPITRQLDRLYTERYRQSGDQDEDPSAELLTVSSLAHSFSRIECVSIRTKMNMSPIGFDLNSIDPSASPSGAIYVKLLSTPHFPIAILKRLVFQALNEAVFIGNLPIRDLPGGSNENLFVPLLKLADKLLLIGCITNQDLNWLLNLIDPETFQRAGSLDQGAAEGASLEPQLLAGLSFLAPGANSPSSIWRPTILEQPTIGNQLQQQQQHPQTDLAAAQTGPSGTGQRCVNTKGLLQMRKLDEHVKLIICHILHHLLDIQLRHRIESIMAFSVNFVGRLQSDQRRRYEDIKNSNLPSHLTARKTREFRCTPKEQMRYILNFKNNAELESAENASPSSEHLRTTLKNLHSSMMKQIKVIIESSNSDGVPDELSNSDGTSTRSDDYYARQRQQDPTSSNLALTFDKLLNVLKVVKATLTGQELRIDSHLRHQNGQFSTIFGHAGQTELKFIKSIVKTIVKWAEESTIDNKQLVRQMFHLLLRCYNGVGELIEALNNSYVIGEKSKTDVIELLQVLSKVRALLAVQMGPAEEEVMRDCLWTLVNNVVFFQHPDLIRILRVHENVMHVMMNTLSKRSRAQSASSSTSSAGAVSGQEASQAQSQQVAGSSNARQRASSIAGALGALGGQQTAATGQQAQATALAPGEREDDISKMVVSCCRFLCFFCRSSAKNQKAMFEHLGFLLENSNILLSRPSLRGSTPLDVAYSSLMENHELVLALRESYLEKIAIYLSRCGLQSNQELIDKGYPDVGWDPVEGERYLDFLRFCVWVNGESVEENSNLVIRLLIRRPECLGPALRGEGPGLFAAIKDAISMADRIHAEQLEAKQMEQMESERQQQGSLTGTDLQQEGGEGDEDEDEINMGSAILNFYCALVDLLGRCAPDLLTIGQGKHESIRALSILKSLVPLQDLKSALSLRFSLVNPQCAMAKQEAGEMQFATTASSFMPNHKQSLVLFLERVYGIEDQETFFALLEEAFLPDMRAATMLERPAGSQAQQALQHQQYLSQLDGSPLGAEQQDEGADEAPENEMTLALNRYLGNSAIPLLIRESHYFKQAENYANLLEPTLHTAYRLSKVKILTKGQRESVSDFLIALTREMQPHQLLKLLRKLTVDVAVLNESTTVALRLLTLHYERCSKYYGYSGSAQTSASGVYGTATEEERRLTMVLFTNIFDSLSLMDYDPELFENALPCLNALACALPPDYSLTESREFSTTASKQAHKTSSTSSQVQQEQQVGPYVPQPVETRGIELNSDLRQLAQRFSEHYHDAWASRKLERDWTYGDTYSFKQKTHPRLKPYSLLTRYERERYIEPIEEAMKALLAMGWSLDRGGSGGLDAGQQRVAGQPASLSRPGSPRPSDSHSLHSSSSSTLLSVDYNQRRDLLQNYNPQPVDTSNLSLSRELQNLAERTAENAHDLWARKTMEDWTHKMRSATAPGAIRPPIMLHPLMVPYDLLTDKEKRKNRNRSQELLKYILFEGYKIYRAEDQELQQQQQQQHHQRGRINSRAGSESNYNVDVSRVAASSSSSKRRFAYSILDKLISYTDSVMVKMELLKPSSNFSRRSSFRQSDRDVKFFSKVVLPLIERYFTAHREFFLNYYSIGAPAAVAAAAGAGGAQPAPSQQAGSSPTGPGGSTQLTGSPEESSGGAPASEVTFASGTATGGAGSIGVGYATIKEKEMLASLFCKLASVLRNKLSVIGPDAKIFVRCLQVLTRALDARSLSEQSTDFVKTSMLTYFGKTAQDLAQCVYNLQMKRYNAVRGTTMRTSSSLYHIHLAVLPTLTALFDHLASSESGKYLLMDDIQIASQKILQSLYVLGTRIQLAGNHQYSRKELERHRHSYGNCLAAFAAAFPIAFLEPDQLRFNRFSCMHTKRTQTLANRPQQGASQPMAVPFDEANNALESMPLLPRLEELMSLVSKYVLTGKGPSSEPHRWAPIGMGLASARATAGANNPASSGAGGAAAGRSLQMPASGQQMQPLGAGNGAAGGAHSGVGSELQASYPAAGAGVAQHSAEARQAAGSGQRARSMAHANNVRMIPADNDAAIIEVIVPMLCSYLPFWFSQGPEAASIPFNTAGQQRHLGAGSGSTKVGSKHLNELLKDIMHLITRQVGVEDGSAFNWMVAIAAHASQIIIDSPEGNLLSESFLPLSTKIAHRAETIYHREEVMRGYLKSAAEDTTAIEEKIQEEFHLLVRDIYAFYPLLIKYVDFKKSVWLKQRAGPSADLQQSAAGAGHGSAKVNPAAPTSAASRSLIAFLSEEDNSEALAQLDEEQQNKPEQLLFHQVATVFDIWSNSQYFRREEQNFISLHEIDNMALIMQASNRPGRAFFQKSDPTQSSSGGRKKKRRPGERREREREIASSLLVVALKRLLPIGMNLFEGRERELVQHVKERFLKKDSQVRIEEVVRWQLTQPYKIDPSDEFGWQHFLYARLGAKPAANGALARRVPPSEQPVPASESFDDGGAQATRMLLLQRAQSLHEASGGESQAGGQAPIDGRLVARIVDMARVFYGLHIIDHPNLQQKAGRRSCVSTQRRRVVIACFRMTSLHSLPAHRAINIFLRSYCDTWLLDENSGQEKLIEDLTQTFEQAESKVNSDKNVIPRSDPLSQLIMTLSRQATTEHGSAQASSGSSMASIDGSPSCGDAGGVDRLYLQFADIFRMSCGGDEEEEEEEDEAEAGDAAEADGEQADAMLAIEGEDAQLASAASSDGADEEEGSGGNSAASKSSIHEQEIEKQRLLFQQSRLSDRGVAEMILLYISAFSRHQASVSGSNAAVTGSSGASSGASSANLSQHTPTILSTLKLGISILRGGNVEVQKRMLKHLKDKRDVGFFTSIQTLMNSCSVLDLDAFERNQKAEALGVRSEGFASEKNMYDAEFTCKLFRFFQLLCEGHNLEFQNYLRTQAGNTTTVNVVISTVDYLLRLQESIMDFYWHYSSKDVIDPSGTENFIKAITIAKQVFCTLTESIQGPCPQNQQALAHSRLWHAVGGFLFLFAHMQDKLSRNSSQLNLLIELLDLQKEMVIMMLSMLEGNVVNGTIGKQMVETLVESSSNVEIILKFFDMFLKLPRLTSSSNFQEYDKAGTGWISLADLRKAMEQHKIYTAEETQYLLSCCEPNHDGMIDYREFIDRFHQPAKDIGFNLAVLLTNLAEHITNEPRLQRFLETASTVLNYFEPYLGRIEIMGSSKRIERVYFEIKESTLDQWAKPQIQESKRAFFYSIVTEGDGKEKLEAFVNFCEDTIFEMQHASNILGEDAEEPPTKADKYPFDAAASSSSAGASSSGSTSSGAGLDGPGGGAGPGGSKSGSNESNVLINQVLWLSLIKSGAFYLLNMIVLLLSHFRANRMRRRWLMFKRMSWAQLVFASFRFTFRAWFGLFRFAFSSVYAILRFIFRIMIDDSTLATKGAPAISHSGAQAKRTPVMRSRLYESAPSLPLETAAISPTFKDVAPDRKVSSSGGKQEQAIVQTVRTEVVTAPSVMRANVADVVPDSKSSTNVAKSERVTAEPHKVEPMTSATLTAPNGYPTSSRATTAPEQDVSIVQNDQEAFALDLETEGNRLGVGTGAKSHKSRGLGARLAKLTNYNQKIISFLARNFYRIKLLALVTAFIINFILLFYKVSVWTGELLDITGAGGALSELAAATSLLSVARKTLGDPAGVLSNGRQNEEAENQLGAGQSRSNKSKLDEIEEKIQRGFANYENTYGQVDEELADEDVVDVDIEVKPKTKGKKRSKKQSEEAMESRDDSEGQDDEDEAENEDDNDEGRHDDDQEDGNEDGADNDEKEQEDEEETELVEFVVMEEKYYYLQPIITFLASIHSLFSLCMLIAYYHLKVPLVIFKREKEIARKLEFDGVYITEEPEGDDWWKGRWDKLVISAESFPVNYWDKFVKKRVREKYREQYDYELLTNLLGMDKHLKLQQQRQQAPKNSLRAFFEGLLMSNLLSGLVKVDWRYQLWKAGVTLTDQSFQYQLLYLIFSLAGHFNYFFFAAHLLDVAVGFKKLQTILQSVTHNGKQLVLTVMLLTIVVYIYTVIAFNFFRKFYVQGDDSPDQKCHSMMTCFVYHLYQGVRAGGGIGDVIEAPDGDDYEVYRIIFDITFFFFVIVILLAIIQGLIIDAFGELRDQLLTVASDMESNCFICGIGKDVLDKVPRGFDTHVQKEHNLANYMFFLMHLINKPDTDYTGQETYVWELYQRRCWDFFPVGECFRTQSEEEADAKPAKD